MDKAIHLILLPGLDGTGTLFAPLERAIAKLRIKPGEPALVPHVLRYPTDEKLGYRALHDRVARYLAAQLPEGSRYVLVGESFGGPLAIMLAHSAEQAEFAQRRQHCVGLVLCCTMARKPYPVLAPFTPLLNVMPLELVPLTWASRFSSGHWDFWNTDGSEPRAMSQVDMRVIRHRVRAVAHVNVTQELAQLSLPILYLQAARDVVVPASCARVVCDAAPQTQVVRIDSPHLLLQTKPEQALDAITTFLAQIGADGGLSNCAFN